MPLSTKELIRNIPSDPDNKNARYVSVFATKNLGPASYLFTTVTRIPKDFTRKHKVWIKDQNGKDVMTSRDIWVSCDCDRFTFKWEYALTRKGASSIRYSNGEPAIDMNPRNIPGGCKHIFRCLNTLARQKRGIPRKK